MAFVLELHKRAASPPPPQMLILSHGKRTIYVCSYSIQHYSLEFANYKWENEYICLKQS